RGQDQNHDSARPGYCGSLLSNGGRIRGHDRVSNAHQRGVARVSGREGPEIRGDAATHHSRGVEVECRLSGNSVKPAPVVPRLLESRFGGSKRQYVGSGTSPKIGYSSRARRVDGGVGGSIRGSGVGGIENRADPSIPYVL